MTKKNSTTVLAATGTKKAKKKQSKKSRKHGRSKARCEAYVRRGQREKNKKAKLLKHIATHQKDAIAIACLTTLK